MDRGRALRSLFWLGVRALLAATIAVPLACAGKDPRVNWPDLRERYFVGFLKRNPVTATYLGGDGHSTELADVNASLPDVSRRGRAEEVAFYRSTLADLEKIDAASLSPDDAIDREVVRAQIRFMLHLLVDLRYDQRSLDTYMVAPFRGVDWQIQQLDELQGGGRGTAGDWDRVTRRVLAVPAFLAAVQATLQEGVQAGNVPDHRMVRYDGIDTAQSNAAYFATTLPDQAAGFLKGQTWGGDAVRRLHDAGQDAAKAFRDFGSFLEEAYRPSAGVDRYACGEAEYDWRLRNNLRLAPHLTAASLFEDAQTKVGESQDLLIAAAKEVGARRKLRLDWANRGASLRSVRAVMDDLSRDYPKSDEEMFRVYRRKAMDLVEYARRHGMFDLPPEYRLEILQTPPMLESTPEAAYYPAPAFKPARIDRSYPHALPRDVGRPKSNNVHP